MLFTLSSSVLFLVAGSTVRASPVAQFFDLALLASDPSITISSSSVHSTSASTLTASITSFAAVHTATNTPSTRISTTALSVHPTTVKKAASAGTKITSAGTKITGGSTFTVPISTPTLQAKTSGALHPASTTASAKATLRPTAGAPSSSNNGTDLANGAVCDGTNDGTIVCSVDGTLFGECDHGDVVMRPVSEGTACVDGAINYISKTMAVAISQVQSYLANTDNSTALFGVADPSALDAKDCPSALLYVKARVDEADSTAGSTTTDLRFVNGNGKTVVDDSDIELVHKADGTPAFQFQHQCTGSSSKVKRQGIALWFCDGGY